MCVYTGVQCNMDLYVCFSIWCFKCMHPKQYACILCNMCRQQGMTCVVWVACVVWIAWKDVGGWVKKVN